MYHGVWIQMPVKQPEVAMPKTRVEALEFLTKRDIGAGAVFGVDKDSILFTLAGYPKTAWLRLVAGAIQVKVVPGFSADRPALWFDGDE